jgi:hypothetical protein
MNVGPRHIVAMKSSVADLSKLIVNGSLLVLRLDSRVHYGSVLEIDVVGGRFEFGELRKRCELGGGI